MTNVLRHSELSQTVGVVENESATAGIILVKMDTLYGVADGTDASTFT